MYQQIIAFWFEEIDSKSWWKKDDVFDAMLCDRFGEVHTHACACDLWEWRKTAEGRLAEIVVLDQFSRNMFRGSPQAFAHDAQALVLAQEAVARGADQALSSTMKCFLYMPYMHSESRAMHEIAVGLFKQEGLQGNLDFEMKHKKIIDRFGRYPHRNAVLGRESTPEELEFLQTPGSGF